MTHDQLLKLQELAERLRRAKDSLNAIRGHTRPQGKLPPSTVVEDASHRLTINFKKGDGGPGSIEMVVPHAFASRFFNEIERYYEGEHEALQAEFERK